MILIVLDNRSIPNQGRLTRPLWHFEPPDPPFDTDGIDTGRQKVVLQSGLNSPA